MPETTTLKHTCTQVSMRTHYIESEHKLERETHRRADAALALDSLKDDGSARDGNNSGIIL